MRSSGVALLVATAISVSLICGATAKAPGRISACSEELEAGIVNTEGGAMGHGATLHN